MLAYIMLITEIVRMMVQIFRSIQFNHSDSFKIFI